MRVALMSGLLAVGLLAAGCGGPEAGLEEDGTVQAADACTDACYAEYRRCMIVAGGELEDVQACVEARNACYDACP